MCACVAVLHYLPPKGMKRECQDIIAGRPLVHVIVERLIMADALRQWPLLGEKGMEGEKGGGRRG